MSQDAPGKTLGQVAMYGWHGTPDQWPAGVSPAAQEVRDWDRIAAAVVRAFLERDGLGDALVQALEYSAQESELDDIAGLDDMGDDPLAHRRRALMLRGHLATIQEARRG